MIELICMFCKEKYKVLPYLKDRRKYCSRKCYYESKKGIPLSIETRKKIGQANRRRVCSKETREKISRASKKQVRSEESKKKASISAKKWRTTLEGKSHAKKLYEKNHERIKNGTHPFLVPENRARALKKSKETQHKKLKEGTHPFQLRENKIKAIRMSARHNNGGTWIEHCIMELLNKLKLDYETQKRVLTGLDILGRKKYLFPDFYLPDYNLIIECDGAYWHRDKEWQKKRDNVFFEQGYKVLHLTGREINKNLESCKEQIEMMISL